MSWLDGLAPFIFTRTQHAPGTPLTDAAVNRDIIAPINNLQTAVEHLSTGSSSTNWITVAGGTADDTASVASAVARAGVGGVLVFRAGVTYTVSIIWGTVAKQRFIAYGATILKKANTVGPILYQQASGIEVFGGTWDGNKTNQTVSQGGIVCDVPSIFPKVVDATIQNTHNAGCQFTGAAPGDIKHLLIERCQFVNCGLIPAGVDGTKSAIYLSGLTNGHIVENRIVGSAMTGIFTGVGARASDLVIRNNDIDGTGADNIEIAIGIALGSGGTDHALIEGNDVRNMPGNGIDIGDSQYARILGNHISFCNSGIVADTSGSGYNEVQAVISGNTINDMTDNFDVGAGIATESGCVVTNNHILRAKSFGIIIAGSIVGVNNQSFNTIVANNIIEDTDFAPAAAIYLFASPVGVSALHRVIVSGNICSAHDFADPQQYGIVLDGTAANSVIDWINITNNIMLVATSAYHRTANVLDPTSTSVNFGNIPAISAL